MKTQWLLLGLMTVTAAAQDTNKEHDGAWALVSMEKNGVKVADEVLKKIDLTLILKGDTYTVQSGDKVIDKGMSIFDRTKKPIAIDIKPSAGPNKGKTITTIVELKGERMIVCYNLDGGERPREFAAKAGSGLMLAHYKKK